MNKRQFKDLFSDQTNAYSAWPSYPEEMLSYLASLTVEDSLVWDCACGSGQASLPLVSLHFSSHFVARASRRRSGGVLGPEDGEGVVDTTPNRLEGERPVRSDASASTVDEW